MLTFSTEMLQIPLRFIGRETSRSTFMFNVSGIVHGQQVFSDVLFYMLKGGKLVNCLLSQINADLLSQIDSFDPNDRQVFPSSFDVKFKDLPKSFGCKVNLSVEPHSKNFLQLSRRMFQLANDLSG